jgi:hypothetical protein
MKDYLVKNFNYINKNKKHFIQYANLANDRFNFAHGKKTFTSLYRYYNFSTLCVGSVYYFKLFYDLQKLIREYSKITKPLWYQCWLNFHKNNEVLNWHDHEECLFHGYVSIDPKKTKTEFEKYTIDNKIGNVYIGPASRKHKVNVLENFDGYRITLGFDVISEKEINMIYKKYGKVDVNLGFIPIVI